MNDLAELNKRATERFRAGDLDGADELLKEVLKADPGNRIANKRMEEIDRTRRRQDHGGHGTSQFGRDPAEALRVIDGPWRSECIAFLGESLSFSQRLDSTRTIVRDVPAQDYFYVASGGHAALGPYAGLMDTYVDGRGVRQALIDRVCDVGGRFRPRTNQGYVPWSIRLEIPFPLIGEVREELREPMCTHIRTALEAGPPQHAHLSNPRLAQAILDEWRGHPPSPA